MHTPTRCLVATWIIELYRHGYELLQLYLAVLGLNLSLRRRSGARTNIVVSPASARSPVPPPCVLDVLTLSPECPTLPLAYTVHSLEQTCFRCSGTLCSIVAFTGVTVGIRSPSRRRQLCWSSFPALCLTGPFLVRIRVFVYSTEYYVTRLFGVTVKRTDSPALFTELVIKKSVSLQL